MSSTTRFDDVIPFPMKAIGFHVQTIHLLVGYSSSRRISPPIQPADHLQTLRCGGLRDEVYDRLIVPQRFSSPVGRDERKQPVLDLVPLAGPRRKMTHRD